MYAYWKVQSELLQLWRDEPFKDLAAAHVLVVDERYPTHARVINRTLELNRTAVPTRSQ